MLEVKHITQPAETSLILTIEGASNIEIANFAEQLRSELTGVIEMIPCTASIYLEFHILHTNSDKLKDEIQRYLKYADIPVNHSAKQEITLPVYYDVAVAPDLTDLAQHCKLTAEEVIRIHSSAHYTVASLGFAPGFAYLTGLPTQLCTPRLTKPKPVKQGSLAIADLQTAVYPSDSPGGWYIIGNCPQPLVDLQATPITPFSIGMTVKFKPIDKQQFLALGGQL